MILDYNIVMQMLGTKKDCYLKAIDLSGQRLSDSKILDLIELLKHHPEIIDLDLSLNGIKNIAATALASTDKIRLDRLVVSENAIKPADIKALRSNKMFSKVVSSRQYCVPAVSCKYILEEQHEKCLQEYKKYKQEQDSYRLIAANFLLLYQGKYRCKNLPKPTVFSIPQDTCNLIFSYLDYSGRYGIINKGFSKLRNDRDFADSVPAVVSKSSQKEKNRFF